MRKNQSTTSKTGILTPDKAAEWREILADPQECSAMLRHFVNGSVDEYDWSRPSIADGYREVCHQLFQGNMDQVFRYCESPIEITLFNSLLFGCVKMGVWIEVMPPPAGDAIKEIDAWRSYNTKLFECYQFFKKLPDDARPKSFRRFLEVTGVETGGLTAEEADGMDAAACVLFDLGRFHTLRLILQPTFKGLIDGKDARPDAAMWLASDPSVKVLIECDGYEYHGDKESFSRDRRRDRIFQQEGFTVRRYSGPEIYAQPIVTSSDLINFGMRSKASGRDWERKAMRGKKPPSASVIQSWRDRLKAEGQ